VAALDDPRDLRFDVELQPRLDLADGHRLVGDRAGDDFDLLESVVRAIPALQPA
jgi:hypothetical protein